jgi:hypothetical protein
MQLCVMLSEDSKLTSYENLAGFDKAFTAYLRP